MPSPPLKCHRAQCAYDIDAPAAVPVKARDLVMSHAGSVSELEINPLAVRPQEHGVAALDAVLCCHANELAAGQLAGGQFR